MLSMSIDKKTIAFVILLLVITISLAITSKKACAGDNALCLPTETPVPSISPILSCTPTPELSLTITPKGISPISAQETPTTTAPTITPTQEIQINTAASANNAGQSATIAVPTGVPETGRVK